LDGDFDYAAVLTREGDTDPSIGLRVQLAIDEDADAFVAVHHNQPGVRRTFAAYCNLEQQAIGGTWVLSFGLSTSLAANVHATYTSSYGMCNASSCEDRTGEWVPGCGECRLYLAGQPHHHQVLRTNPKPASLVEAYGVNTSAATGNCNSGLSYFGAADREAYAFYLGISEHFHTTPTAVGTSFQAAGVAQAITLTWEETDPSRIVVYAISRSDACWGPFQLLGYVDSHDPAFTQDDIHYTYIDETVQWARRYYYRLVVIDDNETVFADAVPSGLPTPSVPSTPSGLLANGVQGGSTWDVVLSWSASNGQVNGYHIYKSQVEPFGSCSINQPYYIGTTTTTQFTDTDAPTQVDLYYRVVAFNATGVSTAAQTLLQVMPTDTNPGVVTSSSPYLIQAVSPATGVVRLAFSLPYAAAAEVAVYDVRGRKVTTLYRGKVDGGRHELVWDRRDVSGRLAASGLYLARLYSQSYGVTTTKFVVQ
jgi:hypothetical protein